MADENPDFKYIVRIATTDVDGKYQVVQGMAKVPGIGVRLATALCDHAGVSRTGKLGDLSDGDVDKLTAAVEGLVTSMPMWMLNRRKDIESGSDTHLHTSDLQMRHRDDLNRLKKIQTYRGVRHATGQKVRGQRSRSNGRTGLSVGVIKRKEGK